MNDLLSVQVVYSPHAEVVTILSVQVNPGSTVGDVILSSQITQHYPDLNWEINRIGIYSRLVKWDDPIRAGDRVEIYRPLHMSPQEARRLVANKSKKTSS